MKETDLSIQPSPKQETPLAQQEESILVSAEEYEWLCLILEAPASHAPRLRAALAQEPVWDV